MQASYRLFFIRYTSSYPHCVIYSKTFLDALSTNSEKYVDFGQCSVGILSVDDLARLSLIRLIQRYNRRRLLCRDYQEAR